MQTYYQVLWSFLLSAMAVISLQAQIITITPTSSSTPATVHFADQTGTPTNYTVRYNPGGSGPSLNQWRFCTTSETCNPNSPGGAQQDISTSGLRVTFSGNDAVIAPIPATKPAPNTYFLNLRAALSDGTTSDKNLKIVVREAVATVFVIDRSGSMDCAPNSPSGMVGWDACTADSPDKWSMVQTGMGLFLNDGTVQGNFSNVVEDRFSVVYFDGDVQSSAMITSAGTAFIDRSSFTGGITADMSSQRSAGLGINGTSLGDGLRDAIQQKFNTITDRKQVAVIITDGVQNADLMLDGSGDRVNDTPTINTRTDSSGEDIEYFCLALDSGGAPASVPILLAALADDPNNAAVDVDTSDDGPAGTASSGGNSTDFIEALVNEIYRENSPQVIDSRVNLLDSTQISENFIVNRDGSSLRFSAHLSGASADDYDFNILKGTEDFTSRSRTQRNGNSAVVTIDFLQHSDLNSLGEWTFRLTERTFFDVRQIVERGKVVMNTVIDDQLVDVLYSVGKQDLRVNDNIEPEVQLSIAGQPVEDAVIQVRLDKPGADKGDLIARAADIPYLPEPGSEVNNPFSVKYNYLQQFNPLYLAPLVLQSNTITLVHQGNGRYTGNFGQADVTGAYHLYFSVEAEDQNLGQIVRNKRMTAIAKFGTLEPASASKGPGTILESNYYQHRLPYKPYYIVNGEERLVGPGYESLFTVESNEEVEISNIFDYGDGSYQLLVISETENPNVTIRLADDIIHDNRPIQEFGLDEYKFHASIHGGITQPYSLLDTAHNAGSFIEIDFGYQLSPELELELIGGLYGFDPDFSILGISSNLRYSFLPSSTSPATSITGALGIGYYKPEALSGTYGFNIRVGAERQFSSRLSVSAEYGYFILPDPDYQWSTIGAALRYKF